MERQAEIKHYERIAILCWRFYGLRPGECLTVHQAAHLLETSPDSAYRLLCSLAHVLPIFDEPGKGRWYRQFDDPFADIALHST